MKSEHVFIAEPITTEKYMIKFRDWLYRENYNENTIKTYAEAMRVFLLSYRNKLVPKICKDEIIQFMNDYILIKNFSADYQDQMTNAMSLFFNDIENKK